MRTLKYYLKILLKNRMMMFWCLLFPIILAFFFNMAFSDLLASEQLNDFKVAVVTDNEDNNFVSLLNEMSTKQEDGFLKITYTNKDKAKKLLKSKSIEGYYVVEKDNIKIYQNGYGTNQTIMKSIADSYMQSSSTIKNTIKENPQILVDGTIAKIHKAISNNNFKDKSINNVDISVIYFYTLIGLSCVNGGTWAIKVGEMTEANQSAKGARLCIAPTSKLKNILAGLTASFIIDYFCMIMLFLFMMFGLGVSFGSQTGYILLLMVFGCICGISIGLVISNVLNIKNDSKISVLTAVTLFMSFLAGMMGSTDIKYTIQENLPILANINPVNLITDALYSLYYYTDNVRYFTNIFYLVLVTIVCIIISLIFARRKQYDSI
ncbi:MAG: ABC transporter permease [Thomasclavelia sp.]|nr:ABC transporter permease [Thomasclavelia sp.]